MASQFRPGTSYANFGIRSFLRSSTRFRSVRLNINNSLLYFSIPVELRLGPLGLANIADWCDKEEMFSFAVIESFRPSNILWSNWINFRLCAKLSHFRGRNGAQAHRENDLTMVQWHAEVWPTWTPSFWLSAWCTVGLSQLEVRITNRLTVPLMMVFPWRIIELSSFLPSSGRVTVIDLATLINWLSSFVHRFLARRNDCV